MELKICNKCGEEKELSLFKKQKSIKCGVRPTCKKCTNTANAKWEFENKEKVIASQRKSRLKNIEHHRERGREYYKNNKDKRLQYGLPRQKLQIEQLSDWYIKRKLIRSGFTKEHINENKELIEVKRLIIKTKRLCKTSQN